MAAEILFDEQDVLELEKVKKKKKERRTDFTEKELEVLSKSGIQKLAEIKKEICQRVFEREEVIDDIFRALITGENVLLLGPPGTGKTLLAELLHQHVADAFMFKWLMNRTTDPADIVGPYSIKSMEKDKFKRVTKGRAAEAELVFFDEIFKSNEPALNFMLSMLNEGVVYNDGKQQQVPLRMAIGASNEYPEDESLEAFFDRFIFRHWVTYIKEANNRIAMARAGRLAKSPKAKQSLIPPTQITLDEIDALQQYVYHVKFPPQIEKNYDRLVRTLANKDIKISDRRYFKGQIAMMANALLEGRMTVTSNDFKALLHIMWNKDIRELEIVEQELQKFANPHESKLKDLLKKAEEVKINTLKIENRTERAAEAVSANATLNDILGKMEDEIDDAIRAGVDPEPLKKFIKEVEQIMDDITNECMRGSSITNRNW